MIYSASTGIKEKVVTSNNPISVSFTSGITASDIKHITLGNIVKINNVYNSFEKSLNKEKGNLQKYESELLIAKEELAKGFPYESEIREKEQRLKEIDALVTSQDVDVFDENFDSDMNKVEKRNIETKKQI